MDLIKEIDENIASKRSIAEDLTAEAKQLLLTAENKERDALISAGLDSHIREIDRTRGVEIERERFEARYANRVLHVDEIKALCVKYNLRFLPTNRFNGKVDASTGVKVAKLMEDHKTEMGSDNSNSFFIMAPPRAFRLDAYVKKVVDLDPVLFYKIPGSEGNYYTYVHKWGQDFTFARRLSGLLWQSENSVFLVTASLGFLFFQIVYWSFVHHLSSFSFAMSFTMLIPAVITGIIFISNIARGDYETADIWDETKTRSKLFW